MSYLLKMLMKFILLESCLVCSLNKTFFDLVLFSDIKKDMLLSNYYTWAGIIEDLQHKTSLKILLSMNYFVHLQHVV